MPSLRLCPPQPLFDWYLAQRRGVAWTDEPVSVSGSPAARARGARSLARGQRISMLADGVDALDRVVTRVV